MSDGSFRLELAVSVEPDLETMERGLWCPVCLLPSAVSVHFNTLAISLEGVLSTPIGKATWCYEHGGALEWPAPPT